MVTAKENTAQLKGMLKDLTITANEFTRMMIRITEFVERESDIVILEETAEDFINAGQALKIRAKNLRMERCDHEYAGPPTGPFKCIKCGKEFKEQHLTIELSNSES